MAFTTATASFRPKNSTSPSEVPTITQGAPASIDASIIPLNTSSVAKLKCPIAYLPSCASLRYCLSVLNIKNYIYELLKVKNENLKIKE